MSIGGGAFVAEIADDGLCLGLGLQVRLQQGGADRVLG